MPSGTKPCSLIECGIRSFSLSIVAMMLKYARRGCWLLAELRLMRLRDGTIATFADVFRCITCLRAGKLGYQRSLCVRKPYSGCFTGSATRKGRSSFSSSTAKYLRNTNQVQPPKLL